MSVTNSLARPFKMSEKFVQFTAWYLFRTFVPDLFAIARKQSITARYIHNTLPLRSFRCRLSRTILKPMSSKCYVVDTPNQELLDRGFAWLPSNVLFLLPQANPKINNTSPTSPLVKERMITPDDHESMTQSVKTSAYDERLGLPYVQESLFPSKTGTIPSPSPRS